MELGTVQYSTLDCGVEKSCIGPELRTVLGIGISIVIFSSLVTLFTSTQNTSSSTTTITTLA